MGRLYYDPNDAEQGRYPSPGPTAEERKQARIKQIQRELAEWNQEWADADEETQAFIASEIDKLEAELKRLQPPQAQARWLSGNTSQPYLLQEMPDGSIKQIENPNYEAPRGPQRAPQTAAELEYDELRNQELRRKLSGEPTEGDLWTRAWNERQFEYKRNQDEIARHQFEQQQEMTRRNNAWKAAMDMGDQQLRAAPMAAIPGQQYFLGFEPGGIAENIAKLSGRNYDANAFRAPIINFDQNEQWRKAWGIFGQ